MEGIPAASVQRQDAAGTLNHVRDVSERCLNPILLDAVDHSKLGSTQLASHDIIDEGERLVGFEHPASSL
jgi:hypothetical protein